jgi:hypothetical protein
LNPSVNIKQTIYIDQPPEVVWDFTQDYSRRSLWDKSIIEANVIQHEPHRIIAIKIKGNSKMNFRYKLDDRPNKTTLAITDVHSIFIEGGGGSWQYLPSGNGTVWSRTDTLLLKNRLWIRLVKPLITFQVKRNTKLSMKLAKDLMETKHI